MWIIKLEQERLIEWLSFVWLFCKNLPDENESDEKFSFSFQDILREKTNHIEQIMKERENDREEMAAHTILYNKNLALVIIVVDVELSFSGF